MVEVRFYLETKIKPFFCFVTRQSDMELLLLPPMHKRGKFDKKVFKMLRCYPRGFTNDCWQKAKMWSSINYSTADSNLVSPKVIVNLKGHSPHLGLFVVRWEQVHYPSRITWWDTQKISIVCKAESNLRKYYGKSLDKLRVIEVNKMK